MLKCFLKSKLWPCFLKNWHCQNGKNKNWACIHELKCLLVFKQVEVGGNVNSLCKNLAEDKDFRDIGEEGKPEKSIEESRLSSIKQKIYNIHSRHLLSGDNIEGLGSRQKASKATKKIFNQCKDWTEEQLKTEIELIDKQNREAS